MTDCEFRESVALPGNSDVLLFKIEECGLHYPSDAYEYVRALPWKLSAKLKESASRIPRADRRWWCGKSKASHYFSLVSLVRMAASNISACMGYRSQTRIRTSRGLGCQDRYHRRFHLFSHNPGTCTFFESLFHQGIDCSTERVIFYCSGSYV